jgi:hypothetical protein
MLRAVAAHGLAGSLLDLPTRPLGDSAFLELNRGVRSQRISGLFWSAIDDGAFPVTPGQRDRAEQTHLQRLAASLLLEDLLLQTVELFVLAGIPYRILKGPAVAHLDYPDPALRVFGDLDVLVPGAFFDDAVAALRAAGCERRYPEPRPGFDREFGKGVCLVTRDGLEIDLHRTFTMGPFGARLALDELWRNRASYTLAGVAIDTLPAEERLLHAAYHTVLGDRRPRLAPMRDVAQIALTRVLDWKRLRSLMRASGGEAVVARAVRTTWHALELADVLAISAWAHDHTEDARASADISLYGASSNYAARSFGTVRAIRTVSGKARFLAALAMPYQEYLAGRHTSQLDRLRRGFQDINRARERS